MAVTVLGGLVTSTVLTLFVVPVLYSLRPASDRAEVAAQDAQPAYA